MDSGNFAWGSENCTRKTRLLDVVYNAVSNELVRTKTLTKNTIVQIDAQPFKQWYLRHYGVELGKKTKKNKDGEEEKEEEVKKSAHVLRKLKVRAAQQNLDPVLEEQ